MKYEKRAELQPNANEARSKPVAQDLRSMGRPAFMREPSDSMGMNAESWLSNEPNLGEGIQRRAE